MKTKLLISMAMLLLAACTKESLPGDAGSSRNGSVDVLKAKVTRSITADLADAAVPNAPQVSCSNIFSLNGQNAVTGQVPHLGNLQPGSLGTYQTCEITDFVNFLDLTLVLEEVWVAANGDRLVSLATVYVVGNPADGGATGTWTGHNTVIGGTGRFADATGQWDQVNGKYYADGTGTWSVAGEITY